METPPQEPISTPPVEQPASKWHITPIQKKIAFYGGIVIVLLLCALGFIQYLRYQAYTNTTNQALKMQQDIAALQAKRAQNPTAGWKTYVNEKYGFEFKYPSPYFLFDDVVTTDPKDGTLGSSLATQELNKGLSVESTNILVRVFEYKILPKNSKEACSYNETSAPYDVGCERVFTQAGLLIEKQEIASAEPGQGGVTTSSGVKGIYHLSSSPQAEGSYEASVVFFDQQNNRIELSISMDGVIDSNVAQADQRNIDLKTILSTFKFINPADTSTWKTYRNDVLGYEISYPPDMSHTPLEKYTSPFVLDPLNVLIDNKDEPSIEGTGFNVKIRLIDGDALQLYSKNKDDCEKNSLNQPALLSSGQTTLSGKQAWQYACESEYGNSYQVIFFQQSTGKVLKIEFGYQSKLHNQILSTFKFTK